MPVGLSNFDTVAGIASDRKITRFLDRAAYCFLLLLAASAPHSIAATQTAWLAGLLFTVIRLFISPRPRIRFSVVDAALWALFIWTVVTAFTSYDPPTSIDKLRGAAVFLLVYFVRLNLRSLRATGLVVGVLLASSMVNVVWTPVQRAIGRGVEIYGVKADGPLGKARLIDGDTILAVNGKKIRSPEDFVQLLHAEPVSDVLFYRPDFEYTVRVDRSDLLSGTAPTEILGFSNWKKSNNWRSSGFYGHYATYAEVLQLLGSLVIGLLVALIGFALQRESQRENTTSTRLLIAALASAFALMGFALLLTVTRASQLSLMISSAFIVLVGAGRKWLLIALLVCIPIAAGGLYFLQRSRNVGFFDSADESTRYRKVMVEDGIRIWTDSPRNFVFGVGADSVKRFWREWGMFEGGNMPVSHFHSTPLQLAVERGLPALLLWSILMATYISTLWRSLRSEANNWLRLGLLFGALGGTIGFLASGIVHYNYGDQEVIMTWYLIMGLALTAARMGHKEPEPTTV
jgi:hypothetical protein